MADTFNIEVFPPDGEEAALRSVALGPINDVVTLLVTLEGTGTGDDVATSIVLSNGPSNEADDIQAFLVDFGAMLTDLGESSEVRERLDSERTRQLGEDA